jgi:hypothetical protein
LLFYLLVTNSLAKIRPKEKKETKISPGIEPTSKKVTPKRLNWENKVQKIKVQELTITPCGPPPLPWASNPRGK